MIGPIEDQKPISEAASEMTPRRRRGRPKKGVTQFWGEWAFGSSEAKSVRGRQNSAYAITAAGSLFTRRHDHPELLEFTGALPPSERLPDGLYNPSEWKFGVLVELGRIISDFQDGDEVAVELAVELAHVRPKPTIKQAITWIRNRRVRARAINRGEQPKRIGDRDAIFDVITSALDDYWSRHPEMPKQAIIEGLEDCLGLYSGGNDDETWDSVEA